MIFNPPPGVFEHFLVLMYQVKIVHVAAVVPDAKDLFHKMVQLV